MSIYDAVGRGVKSVADYDNEANAGQLNRLAVLLHQRQLDSGARADADEAALSAATRQFGTDASANRLLLAGTGNFGALKDFDKAQAQQAKDTAAADHSRAQTTGLGQDQKIKAHDFHLQQLGSLTDPSQIDAWSAQGVRDGVLGMQESMRGAAAMKAFAATHGFEAAKLQAMKGGALALEQLRLAQQETVARETNRHNVAGETEAEREHRERDAIARGQLGVSQGHLGVARENLGLARQAANGVEYKQDADGNYIALPKKPGAGPITASPVLDATTGKPIGAGQNGGKLTEDQGKATGWLVQAENAFKNMRAVGLDKDGKPTAAVMPGFNDALAAVPSLGAGAAIANKLRGADRQKFMQASSSLSEALLRAATGAGVNKDEAAQKIRELTPVWGEAPETTKQKFDSIPLYIESLKVRAGPGAKRVEGINAAAGGGAPVLRFDAQGNPL